jgi:hypothetical protein
MRQTSRCPDRRRLVGRRLPRGAAARARVAPIRSSGGRPPALRFTDGAAHRGNDRTGRRQPPDCPRPDKDGDVYIASRLASRVTTDDRSRLTCACTRRRARLLCEPGCSSGRCAPVAGDACVKLENTGVTFETLSELPATGSVPEQFSPTGQGFFREGMVVRFTPDSGVPWVGNFQPGLTGVDRALIHPDGSRVVVVSGGQIYIVQPDSRRTDVLSYGAIAGIHAVPELDMLLLDQQGIRFEALGAQGVLWSTRRLGWDGFRNVVITGSTLTGDAWTPIGDTW